MSIYQRILKGLCITLIVFASCLTLAGCFFALLFASGTTFDIEIAGFTATQLPMLFATLGGFYIVLGIIEIIVGILGLRAVRRPSLIMPFVVTAGILLAFSLANVFYHVAIGRISGNNIITLLLPLFVLALALICAVQIRRGYAQGTIAELPPRDASQRLGFLRVIQALFAINIIATLVSCSILQSGSYVLGFADVLNLANLVFDGVCFWLIMQRSRATRWWVIGFSSFNIIAGVIYNVATGNFDLLAQVHASALDIFLLLYFIFAQRPRQVLTRAFTVARVKEMALEAWDLWKPTTWSFWRAMIIYYCLFSIMGHWMEAGFCTLIKWGIVPGIYDPNSGIWHDYLNPFPVYGAGMVACAVLLYPIKNLLEDKLGGLFKPLVVSFVINTLVCAGIELGLGLAQNMPDANGVYPLWDYSTMPFNFMGQICLQNSLLFGVVSTLVTWVVFPALQREYLRLPENMRQALFVAVIVFYAIVLSLYVINLSVLG